MVTDGIIKTGAGTPFIVIDDMGWWPNGTAWLESLSFDPYQVYKLYGPKELVVWES